MKDITKDYNVNISTIERCINGRCSTVEKIKHSRNSLKGSQVSISKLKEFDIVEIRKIYAEGKLSQQEIANIYHVSQRTISSIIRNETWK